MTGGLGSAVHRLGVDERGRSRTVVLRRWEHAEAARFVRREQATLEQLAGSGLPCPELLGSDPDGAGSDGHPALLMTRVPGKVHLNPADPHDWLAQMARAAAAIHNLDVPAQPFEPWFNPDEWSVPETATNPALWQEAHHALRQPPPDTLPVFLHRDFQHFNLLWSRERLTGVVDWTFASTGPREIDLGHCRLNLAVLHGADWAEQFRHIYEAETSTSLHPWWDLHASASYSDHWPDFIPVQVDGRVPVDIEGMTHRVEDLIAGIMERL
jgi:aminoglycoside phosphotransferase (APT) family kinase protein